MDPMTNRQTNRSATQASWRRGDQVQKIRASLAPVRPEGDLRFAKANGSFVSLGPPGT